MSGRYVRGIMKSVRWVWYLRTFILVGCGSGSGSEQLHMIHEQNKKIIGLHGSGPRRASGASCLRTWTCGRGTVIEVRVLE